MPQKRVLLFWGCNAIVDVTIPQGVCASIMSNTFPSAYQTMTNIVVVDGVTRISAKCFKGCSALKRVVIPESVLAIYDNAYRVLGLYQG